MSRHADRIHNVKVVPNVNTICDADMVCVGCLSLGENE